MYYTATSQSGPADMTTHTTCVTLPGRYSPTGQCFLFHQWANPIQPQLHILTRFTNASRQMLHIHGGGAQFIGPRELPPCPHPILCSNFGISTGLRPGPPINSPTSSSGLTGWIWLKVYNATTCMISLSVWIGFAPRLPLPA